eukprot:5751128-Amphidinium_carterae.1
MLSQHSKPRWAHNLQNAFFTLPPSNTTRAAAKLHSNTQVASPTAETYVTNSSCSQGNKQINNVRPDQ